MAKQNVITESGAAKYLGLSVRTMSKARSTGSPKIPFIRIGRACRYSIEELDEYLALNTYNSVEKQNVDVS